jgi:hypothetical protein
VKDQGVFNNEESWKKILNIIPDKGKYCIFDIPWLKSKSDWLIPLKHKLAAVQTKLAEHWESTDASGINRWDDLRTELEKNEYAKRKTV